MTTNDANLPLFDQILVDQAVLKHTQTQRILNNLKTTEAPKPRVIDGGDLSVEISKLKRTVDPFAAGKRTLYLTRGKGKHLHHCPGTQKAFCCNLFVIDLVENCPFDCTYCYLQNHLTSPITRVNVNIDDVLADLDKALNENPNKQYRVGTGELGDSLALDYITEQAPQLAAFAARYTNIQLELKTKSNHVDNLLKIDPNGKTVVGWSVNPRIISENEEKGTASISDRFAAAEKVIGAGYKVAFHFDPIVRFAGWNHHYLELINEIFDRFDAKNIAWFSLGTLRFPKGLRQIAMERFPDSQLPLGEFIEGVDRKERYVNPERIDVYERMLTWIRRRFPKLPAYMCMENPAVWNKIFGGKPRTDERLRGIYG